MHPAALTSQLKTIRTEGLSQRVTWRDVQAFKEKRYDKKNESYIRGADTAVYSVLGLLALAGSVFWTFGINRGAAVGLWLVVLLSFLFIAYVQRGLKDSVRFERFAEANAFTYTDSFRPKEKGNIFYKQQSLIGARKVSGTYAGYPFWLGSYIYSAHAGSMRDKITTVGVLCITLPRSIPYLILDGKQNRLQIAEGISRDQKFQLEGDFNDYFDVYCPKGYERDILYYLTPELMVKLIDLGRAFDMEIVDNKMYFYRPGNLPADEALVWRMFTLIDTVAHNTAKNTSRYQDYRINAKTASVGEQGLKLKRTRWAKLFHKRTR